jgi:hypothetical protein
MLVGHGFLMQRVVGPLTRDDGAVNLGFFPQPGHDQVDGCFPRASGLFSPPFLAVHVALV